MKIFLFLGILLLVGFHIVNADQFGIPDQLNYKDLVFIILSQEDSHHENQALMLELNIMSQTNNNSKVYLTHRDLKHIGGWTVIPLLERLWKKLYDKFTWMIFCTHQTRVNVDNIIKFIHQYTSKESFIGKGLLDLEPTIIHHFSSIPKFQYPLFAAGFGINFQLLKRLMTSVGITKAIRKTDFSIDASHELALFLRNNLNEISLINSPHFCLSNGTDCATYVTKTNSCEEIDIKTVFFAVKTCNKFHQSRVSVVQKTWGKRCHNIAYFSDVFDEKIPTVKVDVPNTEHGHCKKSEAILQIMMNKLTENSIFQWVVLADDDTILSVRRVQKLVGCYNSADPLILGERYGYNVFDDYGYNYITGGGGVVLSRGAVMKLATSSCKCPSETTPDDMFLLGICARRLNITLVHIPLFHQARPNDYSLDYLKIGDPISFHKHWMIDPVQIYKHWFEAEDSVEEGNVHDEL